MKHLNVRPKTIKLLEENIGGYLQNIGLGKYSLDMTPKAEATEFLKIDKWNHNELKHFPVSKETINREKRQPTGIGKKYCKSYT